MANRRTALARRWHVSVPSSGLRSVRCWGGCVCSDPSHNVHPRVSCSAEFRSCRGGPVPLRPAERAQLSVSRKAATQVGFARERLRAWPHSPGTQRITVTFASPQTNQMLLVPLLTCPRRCVCGCHAWTRGCVGQCCTYLPRTHPRNCRSHLSLRHVHVHATVCTHCVRVASLQCIDVFCARTHTHAAPQRQLYCRSRAPVFPPWKAELTCGPRNVVIEQHGV